MDPFETATPTTAEDPAHMNEIVFLDVESDYEERKPNRWSKRNTPKSTPYALNSLLNTDMKATGFPTQVSGDEPPMAVSQRALQCEMESRATTGESPGSSPGAVAYDLQIQHPMVHPRQPPHYDDGSQEPISPSINTVCTLFSSEQASHLYAKSHQHPSVPFSGHHLERQLPLHYTPTPSMIEHSTFSPIDASFDDMPPIAEGISFSNLLKQLDHSSFGSEEMENSTEMHHEIMQPMPVSLPRLNLTGTSFDTHLDTAARCGVRCTSEEVYNIESDTQPSGTEQQMQHSLGFVSYAPAFEPLSWSSSSVPLSVESYQSQSPWTTTTSCSSTTGTGMSQEYGSLSSADSSAVSYQQGAYSQGPDFSERLILAQHEGYGFGTNESTTSSAVSGSTLSASMPTKAANNAPHSSMVSVLNPTLFPRIPRISVRNRKKDVASQKRSPTTRVNAPGTKGFEGSEQSSSLEFSKRETSLSRTDSPFPSFASSVGTTGGDDGYFNDADSDLLVYPIGSPSDLDLMANTSATSSISAHRAINTRKRKRSPSSIASDPSNPNGFPCSACKITFARSRDLTRHFRLHTGERPYECYGCGQRFFRVDARKRHLLNSAKKAHQLQPYYRYGPDGLATSKGTSCKELHDRQVEMIKAHDQNGPRSKRRDVELFP
ncbi:hypothetical protein FRB91_003766 [Serendipita sp. 411]|nr:hypothetical protein FRB91_003766 [Serendipita sp. 411]